MEPMGIFFLLAVAVMAAGFALRGPVSRRMGTRQDGGVTSTQIAALTIPLTMTVLLVGAWVSVFLVPDDEFVQEMGTMIGFAALLNYAGCRSHGWHHQYMARTLHRTTRMYGRIDESEDDYSQALRSTRWMYLVVAGLALIQTVMAMIW